MEKKIYSDEFISQIGYPMGGIGAGMICLTGNGMLTSVSIEHKPLVFHEPNIFGAISVNGISRVLEGPVPWHKVFGNTHGAGTGLSGKNYGLPRFRKATFESKFPFGTVNLIDEDLPLKVSVTGWSPFIPLNPDDSSLPGAVLEYTFVNESDKALNAVFSYHSAHEVLTHPMQGERRLVKNLADGFLFENVASEDENSLPKWFSVTTPDEDVKVNARWLRSGWFDPLTKLWQDIESCSLIENSAYPEDEDNGTGASLYIPVDLEPNMSKTIKILLTWYVPKSALQIGRNTGTTHIGEKYAPWYSAKFNDIGEVSDYFNKNYDVLKSETLKFTNAFYSITLPDCVIDAVTANLSIIKSPTVLRQSDGRMWAWEGCDDGWGSCHGTCTHVWNYAFAISSLFPSLERTLRETEFFVSQNEEGHQTFRTNLPITPTEHNFHAACDGQLGGIMKVYREWKTYGDTDWLKNIYPKLTDSINYCIKTWDPDEIGVLIKAHHNTYDIEFWGPDGMCSSFYLGALKTMKLICEVLGTDGSRYQKIYENGKEYCETELFNGEYFIQDIQLDDPALDILKDSKYQYGIGCISDGVIGCWMAKMCGIGDILDPEKVKSHLRSIYKYNMKHDLTSHSNPQRPGYALRDDGGLLLCSWPHGSQPMLPFPYSNEVWTGIEYQVAAHMAAVGMVDECLDIVKTCRDRYDGYRRNPFNEYECGHWYARAMASYALLCGLTGIRYDAVDKILYIAPSIDGDFTSFLSTDSGYGLVGIKNGEVFTETVSGDIVINNIVKG